MKSTAAGVVSATAATLASTGPIEAQAGLARTGAFEMPRNMTLLNMRTAAGPRLGVKLPKGVLDVAAAAARYKLPAPVDTDDLLQNGMGGMPHRQRLLGAGPAVPHDAVHDRQDLRRVRAARSAPGDQ